METLKGVYQFAIADHGGVIVAVNVTNQSQSNPFKKSNPPQPDLDHVLFSYNEGMTWYKVKISEEKLHFNQMLTKPGYNTLVFNIWANDKYGSWVVISLDFKEFLERTGPTKL